MDPAPPLAPAASQSARPPLRSGNRDDQPGAFWSATEPPTSELHFSDVLAIINPLQHLPIIGSIYRELTGDVPHPAARVIGGAIFGGPMGMFSAAINAIVEQETGKDLVGLALAVVRGQDFGPSPDTLAAAPATDAPPIAVEPEAARTPEPASTPRGPEPSLWSLFTPPPAPHLNPPPQAGEGVSDASVASSGSLPREAGEGWGGGRRASPAGARDIGFYLARAGSRVPSAAAMTSPVNAAGATPPAMARPILAAAPAMLPVAPQPEGGFAAAMQRGFDLYRNLKRPDAVGRSLDVVE